MKPDLFFGSYMTLHPCLRIFRLNPKLREPPTITTWAPFTDVTSSCLICVPSFRLSRLLCPQMLCLIIIFSFLYPFFPRTLISSELTPPLPLHPVHIKRQLKSQLLWGRFFSLWGLPLYSMPGHIPCQLDGVLPKSVGWVAVLWYLQIFVGFSDIWRQVEDMEVKDSEKKKGGNWEAISRQVKRHFWRLFWVEGQCY